jgi:hypothetical protein
MRVGAAHDAGHATGEHEAQSERHGGSTARSSPAAFRIDSHAFEQAFGAPTQYVARDVETKVNRTVPTVQVEASATPPSTFAIFPPVHAPTTRRTIPEPARTRLGRVMRWCGHHVCHSALRTRDVIALRHGRDASSACINPQYLR